MVVGVLVAVEIDARSVLRGDQVMVGGQAFTVSDMVTVPGGKRLEFVSGETLTLRAHTVLWASRRITPRRRP
ncbi:hypothetical protein [Streptomyces sp. MP131-18]|uniref:hypothetical protein n=1 Tax=Streptomyces sp. MP131-18 TaxID=1857892 RepID=UPI00097C2821|nr:hypothetical protein [Streptomyces sp. MP131-18]ONK13560.1 hypothetical protein STBA_43300 [Streptomyces sp. MP131-18]